jgi:hypothetical protein
VNSPFDFEAPAAPPLAPQQQETAPAAEKFCRECGAKIRAKAVVCPSCGCAQPVTSDFPDQSNVGTIIAGVRQKPGKVQAIGLMVLIGGIWACLLAALLGLASAGLLLCWPGSWYCIFLGIWCIIKAIPLMGDSAYREPVPTTTSILLIVNIINLDIVCVILGIICVVFCNDREVTQYFKRTSA